MPTRSSRRPAFAGLAGLLLAASCFAAAPDSAPAADRAAALLATHGRLAVTDAGPFVAPGTFRVQVAAKLGRPDLTLPDGTWLYHGHRVPDSEARGTLVVRFDAGRVRDLALVTPAVVAALQSAPARADTRFAAHP